MGNLGVERFARQNLKTIKVLTSVVIMLFSISTQADQVMIERLESGETIATKMGSSFVIQEVIKKKPGQVVEAIFKDIRKLPSVFPNIAFVRPYLTSDGKNLLYIKMRGLGDGLGLLMEMKDGPDEIFKGATTLIASAASFGLRDSADEVDLKKDPQNQSAIDTPKEFNAPIRRKIGVGTNLVLEGPLNQIMEMPSLRMTINLGLGGYKVLKMDPNDPNNEYSSNIEMLRDDTYLVAKVSVGSQITRGELGDFRGFGDGRLSLAQSMGTDVLSALKTRLENL